MAPPGGRETRCRVRGVGGALGAAGCQSGDTGGSESRWVPGRGPCGDEVQWDPRQWPVGAPRTRTRLRPEREARGIPPEVGWWFNPRPRPQLPSPLRPLHPGDVTPMCPPGGAQSGPRQDPARPACARSPAPLRHDTRDPVSRHQPTPPASRCGPAGDTGRGRQPGPLAAAAVGAGAGPQLPLEGSGSPGIGVPGRDPQPQPLTPPP